jgi:aspartate aminotransferase
MPTAADLLPHLRTARLIALNSPLNPCGTVIAEDLLREVCEAIVAENVRRRAMNERPLLLLYDQVYWQLTFGDYAHFTPISLVPEMAPYTVLIDAISKCWAGTGLRVGWAVAPPWIRAKMAPLIGHMGARAGRAEQRAVAAMLAEPAQVDPYMDTFKGALQGRLRKLRDGLLSMRADGLPVDCLDAQGAIYLSARFDLHGRTVDGVRIDTDDAARAAILRRAGVAVVPFTAFGYPENTGWIRFSVGAVTDPEIDTALERLRAMLRSL